MENSVYELVRRNENAWILGNVKTSKYVYENFYEDISTIEAYLNSKHISGDKDSLGRDKPFFNIVLAARNIWFRCTDLDRKNIVAKAKKQKDYIPSLLFTAHLNKWMKEENFGQYLNDWGLYLASYNAAVTKFVEKDDRLHIKVIPWQKMIVDVLNFEQNPIIEILEFTQEELRSHKEYDQDIVENLIKSQVNRKMVDRQMKDFMHPNFVRLYEVHGQMPLSWLTGKEKDKNTYEQQMHVVSFVGGKNDGSFNDFTLYSGREKQNPYQLTQLVPAVDGSISLMGSVKSLFDAQWMTNHTVKNIKDQLDIASKLIFQTNDPAYANQNVLENIEQGQLMIYQQGYNPLAQVQNNSHDISALESFMGQWKELTQTITNTPNVMSGMAQSNIGAYRKELLMIQQSQANFDIMVQNKGLAIERMMRDYITPYLIGKMGNSDELVMELNSYGIDKIDKAYINNESIKRFNSKLVNAVVNGQFDNLPNLTDEQQGVQEQLSNMGGVRFIKPSEIDDVTWADIFEDFESDVTYQITDENGDQQTILSSLNGLLQTIINPAGQAALQTPQGKLIFNEILNQIGVISPVEFNELPAQQMMPQGQGQMSQAAPTGGSPASANAPYSQIAQEIQRK